MECNEILGTILRNIWRYDLMSTMLFSIMMSEGASTLLPITEDHAIIAGTEGVECGVVRLVQN
jgi:hypothetical protein